MSARQRMLHFVATVLTAGLVVTVASRPAFAGITDIELGTRVVSAVQHGPTFGIFDDVTSGVVSGNVTITGWVTESAKRDDILRRASQVDGVRSVTSAIGVLPMTPADVGLRERVARAIYGNALFWR